MADCFCGGRQLYSALYRRTRQRLNQCLRAFEGHENIHARRVCGRERNGALRNQVLGGRFNRPKENIQVVFDLLLTKPSQDIPRVCELPPPAERFTLHETARGQ